MGPSSVVIGLLPVGLAEYSVWASEAEPEKFSFTSS
jgi:hypothetical protein